MWENASFHIHQYKAPIGNLELVHIQTEGSDDFTIPSWLKVGPKVSDDGDMSAFRISLKDPKSYRLEEEEGEGEEGGEEEEGKQEQEQQEEEKA